MALMAWYVVLLKKYILIDGIGMVVRELSPHPTSEV
jgi:hypothetical protein